MSEPCHALVFRDVREQLCAQMASAAVCKDLTAFRETQDNEYLVNALLRSGEIECAIADRTGMVGTVITYLIANGIVESARANHFAAIAQSCLEKAPYKGDYQVSRPEGFAFYGLSPLDYAEASEKISLHGSGPIIVIGVRSIGVVLAEMVFHRLRLQFGGTRPAQVFSVRPSGHPYDRRCCFTESEIKLVTEEIEDADIVIVDEGPGMSGSSFLSVGEALVALGVKPSQITFLCSRDVDPALLVTPHAAERWRRFKAHVVERNHFEPEDAAVSIPAGAWRNAIADESQWPGLWTTMLPATFCSADGDRVFEYHGLGRYGEDVRQRGNRLAEFGYAEKVTRAENGFSQILPVSGHRLNCSDLSPKLLDRIADYLALRAKLFAADSEGSSPELEAMARFNFAQATGRELPDDFALPVHSAVISDSQMMPHQWLQPDDGEPLIKIDCATHGDNHFFPGPADAAWDIAGTIVEWEMNDHDRDHLLQRYAELASDDVSQRLAAYLIAYAAFRNGYCRMAASAMAHDQSEQERLLRDAAKYCEWLEILVPEKTLTVSAYE